MLYGKLHEPERFTSWPLDIRHDAANHVGSFILAFLQKKRLPRFAVLLPPALLPFSALYS